ncbi:MAG: DUF2158 domain-containing protein [Brevinematales bacterium]|nr:DUF2158 domain-containing protein [Brevinematales bacterium]
MSFKVGDVVQLNSGGPKMTVEMVIGASDNNPASIAIGNQAKMRGMKEGDCFCKWFEGKEIKQDFFKADTIRLVEDDGIATGKLPGPGPLGRRL